MLCKILVFLLPTLGFCKEKLPSDLITVSIDMKPYVLIGDSIPFSIKVENSDSILWSAWFHAVYDDESQWIERNEPITRDLTKYNNPVIIKSYFKTCEPGQRQWNFQVCTRKWVVGDWELRVKAWRWHGEVREEKVFSRKFRVM